MLPPLSSLAATRAPCSRPSWGFDRMRVNMDSSIVGDPRFKLVAADLGKSWREVVGSCFLVWLACYERRSERLEFDEADVAAELPGFAASLCRRGLADDLGDNSIRVHGVSARIAFLLKQEKLGRKGGKASGKTRKTKQKKIEANASNHIEANASRGPQAYTPDLDLDLDLSPDLAPAQDRSDRSAAAPVESITLQELTTATGVELTAAQADEAPLPPEAWLSDVVQALTDGQERARKAGRAYNPQRFLLGVLRNMRDERPWPGSEQDRARAAEDKARAPPARPPGTQRIETNTEEPWQHEPMSDASRELVSELAQKLGT